MQDLTQELLKLSVLYTALELSDKASCWARQSGNFACRSPCAAGLMLALRGHAVCKASSVSYTPSCLQICCSFGVDVLEALAASCTQLAAGWSPRAAFNLACDVAVASLLLVLHGATLMSQVWEVASWASREWLPCLCVPAGAAADGWIGGACPTSVAAPGGKIACT